MLACKLMPHKSEEKNRCVQAVAGARHSKEKQGAEEN
jgi:hypothetical protein